MVSVDVVARKRKGLEPQEPPGGPSAKLAREALYSPPAPPAPAPPMALLNRAAGTDAVAPHQTIVAPVVQSEDSVV